MLRIISYNVNGIRAAIRKGFLEWLATDPADIICLQEIKASETDVSADDFEQLGYYGYWYSAEKKGYSGVAILTRIRPTAVFLGNGMEQSDREGRVIRLDFGDLTVVNAYFPSGASAADRQAYKYVWLDEFMSYIAALKMERPHLIITGDYNIAHREIDIHNPKGNAKNSGFLPEERAWLDRWFDTEFVDTLRHFHPEVAGQYSWWSQRFPSVRRENKGWRIDYISVSKSVAPQLQDGHILPDIIHSDHCPVFCSLSLTESQRQ